VSQFKVEVIADSSGRWCGNERVFATCEEAEAYARDLASRWTLVREWRVVETERSDDDGGRRDSSTSSLGDNGFAVTLGPITRVYRALCTTAPSAYDAGTSITLMRGQAGTLEALLSRDQLLSNNKELPARLVLVETNMCSRGIAPGMPRDCTRARSRIRRASVRQKSRPNFSDAGSVAHPRTSDTFMVAF
jgi:hypothetical protein